MLASSDTILPADTAAGEHAPPLTQSFCTEAVLPWLLDFMGGRTPRAFAAARPSLRWATERHHSVTMPFGTIKVMEDCDIAQRCHVITVVTTSIDAADLSASQWWVERCDLPLAFRSTRLSNGALDLHHPIFRQLAELMLPNNVHSVSTLSGIAGLLQVASLSVRALRSISSRPETFCHLRRLTVYHVKEQDASFLLRLPRLKTTTICGEFGSLFWSGPETAPPITSFEVQSSAIKDVASLHLSPSLRSAVFRYCFQLTSFAALATSCTMLRQLTISRCLLRSLDALSSCALLEELSVADSEFIDDLSPLSALAHLRILDVSWTPIASIAPLADCTALERLSVIRCGSLVDLAPLAGAPSLTHIDARLSGVAVLSGLHTCPLLRVVNVMNCAALESLSALSGAPALQVLYAANSNVRSTEGLAACSQLESVDFSDLANLRDLTPLAAAPRLLSVKADNTNLETGSFSGAWLAVEALELSGAKQFHAFPPTWSAPALRRLDLSLSSVQNLNALGGCPLLASLDCALCEQLSDISALASTSQLEFLDLKGTAISTLAAMSACTLLKTVDVTDCTYLTDLSPLRSARRLQVLKAEGSGVRSVSGLEACIHLQVLSLPVGATLIDGMQDFACRLSGSRC